MLKIVTYQFGNIEYNTDYGYMIQDYEKKNLFKHTETKVDSLGLAPGNGGILKNSTFNDENKRNLL
jgi:hypothetical protein